MLCIIGVHLIEYNGHELYLGVRLQYIQYASLFSSGSINFHPLARRNIIFLPTIFIVCKIVLVMNISKIIVTGCYLCLPSIIPLSACFFGIPTSYVFRSLKHDQTHIAECQHKYSIIFLSIALCYRWRYFSLILAWKCNFNAKKYMGQDITFVRLHNYIYRKK